MSYYKKIEKGDYVFNNAPTALQNCYESMKNKEGVVVSNDENGGEFLLVPTPMVDEFVPTAISRRDLISQGFDPSKLTDEQMQEIADKMGEVWVGFGDYWDILDSCAENFGLTKKDEDEDDNEDEESKGISRSESNVPIKGVKCTEIKWCIDSTDVPDADNMTEEEIEKAIEEIESTLPKEDYYPLPHFTNDYDEVKEFAYSLDERLSNKYGYLVYGFNYNLVGIDGKEILMD
jgi:hypothetical protein